MTLRKRNRSPAVDTRVGYWRPYRTSSHRINGSSTNSERVHVTDTNKYKPHYICQFCYKEFSQIQAMAKHNKYYCLWNLESKCNADFRFNTYVCDCGSQFKRRNYLTYHERHRCQKFFICPACNQKLVGAKDRRRHISLCKGKKPTDVVLPVKDEDLHSELILPTSNDNSD